MKEWIPAPSRTISGLCILFSIGAWVLPAYSSDLEQVREDLAAARRYQEVQIITDKLNLQLSAYLEHWELQLGAGWRVVIVSQMRGANSILLAFSPAGSLAGQRTVGAELAGVALCDLDEDGVLEVVLDQLDGWGTGILERTFRVYKIDREIGELWSGLSLLVEEAVGTDTTTRRTRFLRCEPSGWGVEYVRLLYLVETEGGGKTATERRTLRLDGDHLVGLPQRQD